MLLYVPKHLFVANILLETLNIDWILFTIRLTSGSQGMPLTVCVPILDKLRIV